MANEKRLVNAEAIARKLKYAYCTDCNVVRKIQCSACWVGDVLELLEGDSVDAVEVVRCKDCKKWECHGLPFDITRGTCYNPKFHLHHGHVLEECFMPVTNETDFCSYGERKTNEATQ